MNDSMTQLLNHTGVNEFTAAVQILNGHVTDCTGGTSEVTSQIKAILPNGIQDCVECYMFAVGTISVQESNLAWEFT